MTLINERTSGVVASSVEIAWTHSERRRGLLGRDRLAPDRALVITSCYSVHTIGMRFEIDVAFVDGSGRVRKIVNAMPKWRIAGCMDATVTIEFAAGVLNGVLAVGDRVHLIAAPGETAVRIPKALVRQETRDSSAEMRSRVVPELSD